MLYRAPVINGKIYVAVAIMLADREAGPARALVSLANAWVEDLLLPRVQLDWFDESACSMFHSARNFDGLDSLTQRGRKC